MSTAPALKRKAFFIDERDLKRARRELGLRTDGATVRTALREIARMKSLARFVQRSRGSLPPGSFSPV